MRSLALALLVLAAPRLESADLPSSPKGTVADSAGLFTEADRTKLETFGAEVLRARGVALRVLTLQDAKGEAPKVIAVRALNQWRVGPKSVLLLIVMNPRSLYLQPGSALASTFDAATSSQICSSVVAPPMRAKAPGAAALAGLGAIRDRLARPLAVSAVPPSPSQAGRTAAPSTPGPSGGVFSSVAKALSFVGIFGVILVAVPAYWIVSKVLGRKCPECRARMAKDSRVVDSATEASEGLGEYIFTCGGCGHVITEAYVIGRLSDPNSSSSSSDSSSSSSHDSSSSSSSDSGSSSDGGGGGGSDF